MGSWCWNPSRLECCTQQVSKVCYCLSKAWQDLIAQKSLAEGNQSLRSGRVPGLCPFISVPAVGRVGPAAWAPLLARGGSGPRPPARPPCPRGPPLAAAAPALAPYLELRHPDVGGARPAAPPRLAPAWGRRRPEEQPSRASRGHSSPRTPGVGSPRPPTTSQDPQEDAPRSLLPPRAVSIARARTLERGSRGPLATAPHSIPRVPQFHSASRQPVTPEPRSSAAGPASPIARAGDVGAAPGGQGAPAASRAGRQPRPEAPFLVGVSPPGLRVGGRASPGGRRAALGLWARSSFGSVLVPHSVPVSIHRSLTLHRSISASTLSQEFCPSHCPPRASIFTFFAFVFSLGD